ALSDRRPYAGRACPHDQSVAHFQSGVLDDGDPRGVAAGFCLAHTFGWWYAERCRFIRDRIAAAIQRRHARGSATLSQHLLLAHLGWRLLGRLLRLHVELSAG